MIIKSIEPSSPILGKLYNYVSNFSIRVAAVTFAYVSFYDITAIISPATFAGVPIIILFSCQKMWSAYDVCCNYSNAIIAI